LYSDEVRKPLIDVVNVCRVALKRGEAVSKELNKTYGDDKKMSKQEKEERQV